ncbi:MAG: hypothetical protein GF308_05775 [Candidatus Heimdallarchaeota archaeon]|nr:hypothetical protein [Candidatus Heimdallarchaeota archaeon]
MSTKDEQPKSKNNRRHSENSTKSPSSPESFTLKIRWSHVFMIAIILAVIVIAINLLLFWILLRNDLFGNLPLWLLIECALLLIFGGCLGTAKQSFMISYLKNRLVKGEKITGKDTKIAIGSAYTYIIAGFFIGFASFLSWIILNRFFMDLFFN